jgi:hypothetical protein
MSDFDFIIVGGGSAGCALARRLSDDPSLRVCLIEAGAKARNPAVHLPFGLAVIGLFNNLQWGYETAPQDQLRQRNLVWPRGRVLGGSSAVNAMIYARGGRRWAPRAGTTHRSCHTSARPRPTSGAATKSTARTARCRSRIYPIPTRSAGPLSRRGHRPRSPLPMTSTVARTARRSGFIR